MAKKPLFNKHGLIIYCTTEELARRCSDLRDDAMIGEFAFAQHDKDMGSNGKLKEKHIHLYLTTPVKRAESTVKKMFANLHQEDGTVGNVLIRSYTTAKGRYGKPIDLRECDDYLTHENDATKYHYERSIIFKSQHWDDVVREDEENDNVENDTAVDIVMHLLAGDMTNYQLMQKYGRDFILHYKQYRDFALACDPVDDLATDDDTVLVSDASLLTSENDRRFNGSDRDFEQEAINKLYRSDEKGD